MESVIPYMSREDAQHFLEQMRVARQLAQDTPASIYRALQEHADRLATGMQQIQGADNDIDGFVKEGQEHAGKSQIHGALTVVGGAADATLGITGTMNPEGSSLNIISTMYDVAKKTLGVQQALENDDYQKAAVGGLGLAGKLPGAEFLGQTAKGAAIRTDLDKGETGKASLGAFEAAGDLVGGHVKNTVDLAKSSYEGAEAVWTGGNEIVDGSQQKDNIAQMGSHAHAQNEALLERLSARHGEVIAPLNTMRFADTELMRQWEEQALQAYPDLGEPGQLDQERIAAQVQAHKESIAQRVAGIPSSVTPQELTNYGGIGVPPAETVEEPTDTDLAPTGVLDPMLPTPSVTSPESWSAGSTGSSGVLEEAADGLEKAYAATDAEDDAYDEDDAYEEGGALAPAAGISAAGEATVPETEVSEEDTADDSLDDEFVNAAPVTGTEQHIDEEPAAVGGELYSDSAVDGYGYPANAEDTVVDGGTTRDLDEQEADDDTDEASESSSFPIPEEVEETEGDYVKEDAIEDGGSETGAETPSEASLPGENDFEEVEAQESVSETTGEDVSVGADDVSEDTGYGGFTASDGAGTDQPAGADAAEEVRTVTLPDGNYSTSVGGGYEEFNQSGLLSTGAGALAEEDLSANNAAVANYYAGVASASAGAVSSAYGSGNPEATYPGSPSASGEGQVEGAGSYAPATGANEPGAMAAGFPGAPAVEEVPEGTSSEEAGAVGEEVGGYGGNDGGYNASNDGNEESNDDFDEGGAGGVSSEGGDSSSSEFDGSGFQNEVDEVGEGDAGSTGSSGTGYDEGSSDAGSGGYEGSLDGDDIGEEDSDADDPEADDFEANDDGSGDDTGTDNFEASDTGSAIDSMTSGFAGSIESSDTDEIESGGDSGSSADYGSESNVSDDYSSDSSSSDYSSEPSSSDYNTESSGSDAGSGDAGDGNYGDTSGGDSGSSDSGGETSGDE